MNARVSFFGAVLDSPDVDRAQTVQEILTKAYPAHLRRRAHAFGIRVVVLGENERYFDRSDALRRLGARVDDWPLPPAGLFVVGEKTVYLRSLSPMTIAHEYGHALDAMLGGGVYHSGASAEIRAAFAGASRFVTPYAASGLDEYFAESVRAYTGTNDPRSPWPEAMRARLREVDPAMYRIVARIFARPRKAVAA